MNFQINALNDKKYDLSPSFKHKIYQKEKNQIKDEIFKANH